MTIQTENMCEKCYHKKLRAHQTPCNDCDHRVNKITYHNNFRPKESAFRGWNNSMPASHFVRVPIFRDQVERQIKDRKEGWNAAIDRVTHDSQITLSPLEVKAIEKLKEL